MFNNLLSFLKVSPKRGPVLGVDIGTVSIKVAEITPQGGTPTLTNYGIIEVEGYLERHFLVYYSHKENNKQGRALTLDEGGITP